MENDFNVVHELICLTSNIIKEVCIISFFFFHS
jgi:hypothetical protein